MGQTQSENGSVELDRLRRALLVAGAATLLIGGVWHLFADSIDRMWTGYYGNWRDAFLMDRLDGSPGFFLGLGALFLLTFAALRASRALVSLAEARQQMWHQGLLGACVAIGAGLSLREWGRYGYPCWDAYCDRAALWSIWLSEPTAANFDVFANMIYADKTGTSVVPVLIIGTIAATGLSVMFVYQLVVALCWAGVAWGMVVIGRRHLGFDRHACVVMCVLLFGHLGVMRSLLFPQTDVISLLALLTVIALSMSLGNADMRARVSLVLVLVVGFFTKLSFVPAFAAPVIAWLFPSNGSRTNFVAGASRLIGLFVIPMLMCGLALYALGFVDVLTRELSLVYEPVGNFEKDNNPLRFALATISTVQFFPLVLWFAPEPWTGARRQLASMLLLVLLALVVMKTAFWVRYMLPVHCMLTMLVVGGVVRVLGRGFVSTVGLALYVAANGLFLLCDLYL